ncbi:uncharacterized protein LOC143896209 isoform X2 [Temnothorax americanus]|uniref:uncharacterized protein LOC143896209 isoform X2 n=1 Tax=Temnothorax americanus TaxID=1964332 RepID=UPI00406854F2
MIPSKSKRSESRRSSILKPRKPRQPLRNVNFDSSSNEDSPAASKAKRRVSFAEKKHVKEFCHSTEQGTVWDNTYEEHDFSLKGSVVVDRNDRADVKDNVSLCASNNDRIHIRSENDSCSNNTYLVNDQFARESVATTNEEDDTSYRAVSSGIVAYSDTDEESPDKESQARRTVMTTNSQTSKNVKSSSITIYRDEEDYADNDANKCYSKSCSNNVNSELDEARVQDLSMELTAPIPAFLSSSYAEGQKKQKRSNINNLDTNYTTTCNNVSMEITEAIPISAKSIASDLGHTEQAPTMLQNCENTTWDAVNARNATATNCANDSMVLTSVIQQFTDATGIGICLTSDTAFDTFMGRSGAPFEMYEKNVCEENMIERKDQTDKTEIFNDVLMDVTKPVSTILFSSVCNEDNSRMDEPISRDDRTVFFRNVSMEMTETVSTRNKRERANTNTGKSLSEETAHGGEDANTSICFNEGTKILCKSMELTEAVPAPLHCERTFRATRVARSLYKNTCEEYKNDASMELTNAVNMLPLNIGKENLKIDESRPKDDKTVLFNNVSMEMTAAVSSRNQNERTQPIICKSISKENNGEKDRNASTCFDEGTRLLCKSMEFTEVVPISLHDERTFNATRATRSTFSQTLPKTTSLPAENSAGVAFQIDTAANKTIQDISIEFTAAVPSTLQLRQDVKVNRTENLIISKNDKFQHLMANNNRTKSNKGATKENFIISREIVEAENIRPNELSDDVVIQSPPVNLDRSSNANFENASGKKRMSDASERSYRKRVRSSFMEVQSSRENDIHSLSSANPNYVNDVERNECFVKDIADHTQVSDSNFGDSLNKINEHSFLKKNLSNNSLTELQSITPPSTLYLDNEDNENSSKLHEIQRELHSSIIADIPVNNISDRLIISDVTESKCLKEKLINIENNQSEDCHRSTAVDKNEDKQTTTCQTMTKTRINDNQPNKSTYYTTKTINEESTVSMNSKNGKALTVKDINHCREREVTDEDQVDERGDHAQRRINKEAKLQTNIKMREQYSDDKRQEKCSSDHLEGTGALRGDSEEGRKNLNDEVKQQCMEQKNDGATKKLVTARYNTIEDVENGSLTEQNPFLTLSQKLETHAVREDCIWNVYYKNLDRKTIVFGFMSNSLLIAATFLSYDFNHSEENLIKEIKIISRVSDDSGILIRIVHKLILEKINAEILTKLYKTHQDILPMLNFISQDVKLAMDFMFDLRRLDDLNLMEITYDEISFVSRSKRMDIILRVTIKVKQFDKLTSNDISLHCLLGRIKETDIKNLIKNVKRDHKFLRRYMNDVKDYIDIMEETQII